MWQVVVCEHVPDDMVITVKPVLFVCGDQVYRVTFTRTKELADYNKLIFDIPVNKLDWHIDGRIAF